MWTSTRVALVTHRDGERPNLRDIPVLLERARREADGAETDVRLVRVDVIRDEVGELRFRHRGGVATCRSAFLGGHLAPENERVRCGPTFLLGYPIHRGDQDRKSTRLNSSHVSISYAVFCLKKKNTMSPR